MKKPKLTAVPIKVKALKIPAPPKGGVVVAKPTSGSMGGSKGGYGRIKSY